MSLVQGITLAAIIAIFISNWMINRVVRRYQDLIDIFQRQMDDFDKRLTAMEYTLKNRNGLKP